MEQRLRGLMVDLFKMPEGDIVDTLAMEDVGVWDSLKHMELIVSIEESFGIELTFEEIVAMQTFGEIKRILRERGLDSQHGPEG